MDTPFSLRHVFLLEGFTPAWALLRPIEILLDELNLCPTDTILNLDLTEIWAFDDTFKLKMTKIVSSFDHFIETLKGDKENDLTNLSKLVGELTLGPISSVDNLTPEEKMFVLIGTYWGKPEREALYSLEYFGLNYWTSV
jgi:hypothetical protein